MSSTQTVYFPVNSVSFCSPEVFLTAGSDGVINIWDKKKKSLVNQLNSPQQNQPITSARFICDNKFLAYSVGYDYSLGSCGLTKPIDNLAMIKIVDEPLVKS